MNNSHVFQPNVPGIISLLSGGVHPFAEAYERAAQKTERQPAKVANVEVDVTISVEAIANNWNRVVNRLEREIDRFGKYNQRETWYLSTIHMPNPAYDGWTIVLAFEGLEDMNQNLERLRAKIERICNDKRR